MDRQFVALCPMVPSSLRAESVMFFCYVIMDNQLAPVNLVNHVHFFQIKRRLSFTDLRTRSAALVPKSRLLNP